MSGINARTEYELNAGGEPVKNATYWKRQHDKLADRIAELEEENRRIRERIWDSDFARKFLSEIREAKEKQGIK